MDGVLIGLLARTRRSLSLHCMVLRQYRLLEGGTGKLKKMLGGQFGVIMFPRRQLPPSQPYKNPQSQLSPQFRRISNSFIFVHCLTAG